MKPTLRPGPQSRLPLHTQASTQRHTGGSNPIEEPGQTCGSDSRMTAYLCPPVGLCEYFDTRKGIQAHFMAVVMRYQDSKGACHDKRDITPEKGSVHCKP